MTTVDLTGKVAVVTGAGRGIGREHALALASAGASVVVNDMGSSSSGGGSDESPAKGVVGEIQASGGQAVANLADVTVFDEAASLIEQAVGSFGSLDILVNNAGIVRDKMLFNMTESDWDDVVKVHLKGHFAPLHHAAKYWRQRSKEGHPVKGRVINTSSPSGLFGTVGQSNYGAAKAGIAALTVIAALELVRYGVTVNCLVPNARTRMTNDAFGLPDEGEAFDQADPANISPLVVALASDELQDVTGQCFFIFGGLIDVLQSWSPGVRLEKEERWLPQEIVARLQNEFPEGIAPVRAMPRVVPT